MDLIIEWVSKNYTWLFSGIGVFFLSFVFYKNKSKISNFTKNIRTGDNSTVIQAENFTISSGLGKQDILESVEDRKETMITDIFSKYIGKDFYIFSKEHDEFGFRIFGEFDNLLNIEILFNYTNGLYYVNKELNDIFYPLIDFGERVEITNEIRKDKLGIRLKCHYLNAEQKKELINISKIVILKSFYEYAKIPSDAILLSEIYNKKRHPTKPEWIWTLGENIDKKVY